MASPSNGNGGAYCSDFRLKIHLVNEEDRKQFYSTPKKEKKEKKDIPQSISKLTETILTTMKERGCDTICKIIAVSAKNNGPGDLYLTLRTSNDGEVFTQHQPHPVSSNEPGFAIPEGQCGFFPREENVIYCAPDDTGGIPIPTSLGFAWQFSIPPRSKTNWLKQEEGGHMCTSPVNAHITLRVVCCKKPSSRMIGSNSPMLSRPLFDPSSFSGAPPPSMQSHLSLSPSTISSPSSSSSSPFPYTQKYVPPSSSSSSPYAPTSLHPASFATSSSTFSHYLSPSPTRR
jgi:hypothetical protein